MLFALFALRLSGRFHNSNYVHDVMNRTAANDGRMTRKVNDGSIEIAPATENRCKKKKMDSITISPLFICHPQSLNMNTRDDDEISQKHINFE